MTTQIQGKIAGKIAIVQALFECLANEILNAGAIFPASAEYSPFRCNMGSFHLRSEVESCNNRQVSRHSLQTLPLCFSAAFRSLAQDAGVCVRPYCLASLEYSLHTSIGSHRASGSAPELVTRYGRHNRALTCKDFSGVSDDHDLVVSRTSPAACRSVAYLML
jgi:hypothetical protein